MLRDAVKVHWNLMGRIMRDAALKDQNLIGKMLDSGQVGNAGGQRLGYESVVRHQACAARRESAVSAPA